MGGVILGLIGGIMAFIIILVALLIERFLDWSHLRRWGWLPRYHSFLQSFRRPLPAELTLFLFIAIPLLIVGLLDVLLSGWFFGFIKLVFGILVLVYCLGPANLWGQAYLSLSLLNAKDREAQLQEVLAALHVPFSGNPQ